MSQPARTFLLIGAILMFLAVALGAFGAHGLKSRVSPEMLAVFETGVRYHVYHGLGILLIASLSLRMDSAWLSAAGWLMGLGVLLFSGSLYLMVLLDASWLGIVTPLGGTFFLLGWLAVGRVAIGSPGKRDVSINPMNKP